jgi:hypothetical protein
LITIYPGPRARKRDVKTIKKLILKVAENSIIIAEEIEITTWDMGHGINGGDEDGNPTQYGQDLGVFPQVGGSVRARCRNRSAAASDTDVGKCGVG